MREGSNPGCKGSILQSLQLMDIMAYDYDSLPRGQLGGAPYDFSTSKVLQTFGCWTVGDTVDGGVRRLTVLTIWKFESYKSNQISLL